MNAALINYEESVGYINFVNEESKVDAVNSKSDDTFPIQYSIEEYDHAKHMRGDQPPFAGTIGAAYRPSVHPIGSIMMRFLQYGHITGTQTIPCPYDSDRAFFYCNYYHFKESDAASEALSTMAGHTISQNSDCEDVLVWRNMDEDVRSYGQRVNVQCDHEFSDDLLAEILEYLNHYGAIESIHLKVPSELNVKFKYSRSVFQMFYDITWHGRINKTLEKSGTEIAVKVDNVSHKIKQAHSIKFTSVPKHVADAHTYISNLLDLAGCNPGVLTTIHNDRTKIAWVILPHPWYVRDVSCKVHQFLSSVDAPQEYAGLGVVVRSPFWQCDYMDRVDEELQRGKRKKNQTASRR